MSSKSFVTLSVPGTPPKIEADDRTAATMMMAKEMIPITRVRGRPSHQRPRKRGLAGCF